MDFFVSKVAMAICALLVISILTGSLARDRFVDSGDEVETLLTELCDLSDRGAEGGAEGTVLWTVPALSTGDLIRIEVEHGVVQSSFHGRSIMKEPSHSLHTWAWDGTALNETTVGALDDRSNGFTAATGDTIMLRTRYVSYENERRLMVFASAEPG